METTDKMLTSIQEAAKPKPGLSAEAKRFKDALTVDPYNLEYMFALGVNYSKDNQWTQAENVLVRGWKRVKEFSEKEKRFSYLQVLLRATLKNRKYKQAAAVLQDMEEPEKEGLQYMYYASQCEVMGFCKENDKCLKAFNNTIDGLKAQLDAEKIEDKDKFQQIIETWAHLIPALEQADILELTREKVAAFATNDEDKAKLDVYEKLSKVRQEITDAATVPPSFGPQQKLAVAGLVVMALILMYILYKWEQSSLAKLNISK